MHVDGASGAFVAPFVDPDLEWDFRLPRVASINASGHKYGLVYPGVGWVVWRDADALPEDLVFWVNYLGDNMPTFALNFSRPGAQVVAQYYNFLRLGFDGYRKVQGYARDVATRLSGEIAELGPFELLTRGDELPVFAFTLQDDVDNYTVFDVSNALRERGWLVPAYTFPKNREDLAALRVVVRRGFTPRPRRPAPRRHPAPAAAPPGTGRAHDASRGRGRLPPLSRGACPETPPGWTAVARRAVGPFTTHVTYRRPDGGTTHWASRVHRKHASLVSRPRHEGVWWAPRRASWWIGVLFALGSACFLVGPFPGFVEAVGSSVDGVVFFVGSIFFTSAAALQCVETFNADRGPAQAAADGSARGLRAAAHRLVEQRRPVRRNDPVQREHLPSDQGRARRRSLQSAGLDARLVGSACFLVSATSRTSRSAAAWRPAPQRTLEWRIAAVNLLGCVAFGISALAAFGCPRPAAGSSPGVGQWLHGVRRAVLPRRRRAPAARGGRSTSCDARGE